MKCIFTSAVIVLAMAVQLAGKPYQSGATGAQDSQAKAPTIVAPIDNFATRTQTKSTQDQTPKWYATAEWPNWALVVVGVMTLCAIWKQAKETARAAGATELAANATRDSVKEIQRQIGIMERQTSAIEKSAEAAEKSIKLQETALRQWVDIENWRATPWMPESGVQNLSLQFDVVNSTELPVTFTGAFVVIDDKPIRTTGERKNLIPPKNRFPVVLPIEITAEQLAKWENDKLTLFLYGWILFEDALQKQQGQSFNGAVVSSHKNGTIFIPPYGSGIYIADKAKDKNPKS
jgi:hypothetical protein